MSEPVDRAAEVRANYEARAIAEIADADNTLVGHVPVPWSGAVLASVVAVKGLPGPAEAAGGAAMSGADGEALEKALEALGWPSGSWFFTVSRVAGVDETAAFAKRVRAQVEAVGARVVVALDGEAAADLAGAFDTKPLRFGSERSVAGRRLVAVEGFEGALAVPGRKRVVWSQLQKAAPDGPVY